MHPLAEAYFKVTEGSIAAASSASLHKLQTCGTVARPKASVRIFGGVP
jgi:hypothetical protein